MADGAEHEVSSTSLLAGEEVHHYQPEPEPDRFDKDLFTVDDIVDLIGGAQDALNRHMAEDSAPHGSPETPLADPVTILDPEPVPEPEPEPEPELETATPDTTDPVSIPEIPGLPETVAPVAPKAEPESSSISPRAAPEPEPAPESDALPPAEPRTRAAAPAEAAERPAVTDAPAAPASYVPPLPSSKAQPLPLMQFPTALGQKGDSPAPISPLSPLHSPDSLEELSLTESPNQPPALGPTAPLGSFLTEPRSTREMSWGGEKADSGPTRSKNTEDPLAGPYLSLGKDPGPHNPCEDSGVSFSPEERMVSSDRLSTGPSPVNPQTMTPESHLSSSNPTDRWDSPLLVSQDNSKVSMDAFSKDMAPINQFDEDDDLMGKVKKNNNPFDGFSPLEDSGHPYFGDTKTSKMSDSPTPDLVQYGQTEEPQHTASSYLDEGKAFEKSKIAPESFLKADQQFSSVVKDDNDEEEEDSALPPSLPDILKSSPLNPDKIDSGSSEGSPEEQSPILERRMMESPNPPINLSANNPFAFDAKVSLLKEMTEEMEVKVADEAKEEDDKSFRAFDLVQEAKETPPTKIKQDEPIKIEQKDWFSSYDAPKPTEKLEPLDFKSNKPPVEDSDSESPTADSLSPVLEAMAKNPASFQVETVKNNLMIEMDEPDVAEEVSEHEVSSEEFEFIERPPRGVIDEFLEALDTSKFGAPKPPEIPLDDDLSFEKKDASPVSSGAKVDAPHQTSYHLLDETPPPPPQKSKAELEELHIRQPPPQEPSTHPPVKLEEAAAKNAEGGRLFKMPMVNVRAVVDLVYWRDVKTSGVVFGASLLLLLSLMACSIVSVCSYIGLALLSVTICFRIYKGILQAIQKSDEGHPFKQYLDQDVALSQDLVHKYSDVVLSKLNKTISELRRLFLVEDLVDSIKFALLMWILTYVGALFNGLTVLILGLIGAFSCPIIYEKHQAQIDHYLALVDNQIKDIVGKIQAKVPGMKRKTE
ncbi:reticulon-1-like isoform X1 [Antennarius striatus]|uniref:reticulon-1-like isoform X1 n=1 Tax=Antennarius striatus TaxID=241820 RepID=UPI0035B2EB8C